MAYIKSITGKIEVVGQHNRAKDGIFYYYLRFLDENGNVRMIKSVMVPNTVDSYIFPGTEGTFHLLRVGRKNLIFAYNNDNRFVYDPSDTNHLRLVSLFYLFLGLCFTIPGIIISLYFIFGGFIFSLLPIAVIISTIVIAVPTWIYLSLFLWTSNKKLKNYLRKFGFSF